jgi:hypothetical protein
VTKITDTGKKMSEPKTKIIDKEIIDVLKETIENSLKFEELSGKQLNITGIVGEVLAAEKYKLELVVDDINTGFDAIDENKKRVQIKTRRMKSKKSNLLSKMSTSNEADYDYTLLIVLDKRYNPKEIYHAEKEQISSHFDRINAKRKVKRNTMSISQFKSFGKLIYELK